MSSRSFYSIDELTNIANIPSLGVFYLSVCYASDWDHIFKQGGIYLWPSLSQR